MIWLQLTVGIVAAFGVGFILSDILHIPTFKATRAASRIRKRGEKKVGVIDIYLQRFSAFLAQKLRIGEYKRAQLEADLRTAGMDTTPEAYLADAITKALAIGIFALPVFLIWKPLAVVFLVLGVVIYFKESKKVTVKIRERRHAIEYELPNLASAIERVVGYNRDVISILDSYRSRAGDALREELEITVADMRSGNEEVALTRLEARVGSTMMSDVTRGLIALCKGDDTGVYWASLSIKLADYQRQQLRQRANAVPRKVRKLSMALLFCFTLIYVAVIAEVILSGLGNLF